MINKLYFLALIPALVFSAGCGDKKMNKDVNVIIISGQSNAVGCKANINLIDSMGQEKYNEYKAGYEDIKIAYSNWTCAWDDPARPMSLQNSSKGGAFVKVELGQGNNKDNFGPEVGIAEELHEKWGNKLYIIKIASGASNLNDDWAQTTDFMYKKMVEFVDGRMKSLSDEGLNPILRAFCWMQGEGDAFANYYDFYYDNLVRFKEHLDKDFSHYTEDGTLPFIDAGIGDGDGHWQYYKEVNECKVDFANLKPTNIYIDTIAEGLHTTQEAPDHDHYDSDSQIKLGRLFAQNFEQFLK